MAASNVDLWALAFSNSLVVSSLDLISKESSPETPSCLLFFDFSNSLCDCSQSTSDLRTLTRPCKDRENEVNPQHYQKKKSHQWIIDFQRKRQQLPTWSDEPLTEAVWEAASEFGSVFWVPWAILDRVVTYSLNWKMMEIKLIIFAKEDLTNLNTVYNIIKINVSLYHSFKQVWRLKITVIIHKDVNKHLWIFAYFL